MNAPPNEPGGRSFNWNIQMLDLFFNRQFRQWGAKGPF